MIFGLSIPEIIFYCVAVALIFAGFLVLILKVDFERKIDPLAGCILLIFVGAGFVYSGRQIHFNDITLNQLSSTKDTLTQSKAKTEELFEKKTELESEIKGIEKIYESKLLALNNDKAKLVGQSKTINQRLDSAHSEKNQLLKTNTELNKEISSLEYNLKSLNQKLADANTDKNQLLAKNTELNQKKAFLEYNFKSLKKGAEGLIFKAVQTYTEEAMDDKEKLKNISLALGKFQEDAWGWVMPWKELSKEQRDEIIKRWADKPNSPSEVIPRKELSKEQMDEIIKKWGGMMITPIPRSPETNKKNEQASKLPSSKPSSSITPKPPATFIYRSPVDGLKLFQNNEKFK